MNIYKSTGNQNTLSFIYQVGELNLANIYLRNFNFKVGARYEHYDFSKYLKHHIPDGYQEYGMVDRSYQSLYFKGEMDNQDDEYFASSGMSFDVEGAYWPTNYTSKFTTFGAVKVMVSGVLKVTRRFVVLPQFYGRVLTGDCTEIPYLNYYGGTVPGRYFGQQLPFVGINYANPTYNSVMIGRVDFRQRMGKNHYVYGMVNCLRSAMGLDGAFSPESMGIWGVGVQYSYDSPIGPLSFNVHWSDYEHKFGAYVSLGYYF
jgi:NTE family protein